jgi:prevent-host-death family protein
MTQRGLSRPRVWHLVLPGAIVDEVSIYAEISQRDLRARSREIMDAVENGQSFTVTRDGHQIAELIPLRRRRRLVPREEFVAMSRNAPVVDLATFRADQRAALDDETGSAYDR